MFTRYTLTLKLKYGRTYNNFTGKISKIILLSEFPELEILFRPAKGFLKPVHVSPIIGKEGAVYAYYEKGVLKEAKIDGEYKIKVGIPEEMSKAFEEKVKEVLNVKTRVKMEGSMLEYTITNVEKEKIEVKDRFKLCFSPTVLSNPFIINRDFRKFLPTPSATFWIPYAIMKGKNNVNMEDIKAIEESITETWKSRIKTIWIPYDTAKEPVLVGKVEYKLLKSDEETKKVIETALTLGVGSSRASGFGHVEMC